MTKADFFEKLEFPVVRLYMDCEDRLLRVICKRLSGGADFTGENLNWNLKKLNDMGGMTRDAVATIAQTAKKAKKMIANIVDEAVMQGLVTDGVSTEITDGVRRSVEGLLAQAESSMNMVNTTMLAGAQDSYGELLAVLNNERNIIMNRYAVETSVGVRNFRSAVASAVRELSENGITAFEDKSGRRWSPEAYVSMDLRTTTANATRQAVQAQGKDLGFDIILVSSHADARPLCAKYQGRCFSMSGRSGTITDAKGRRLQYEPISVTGYNPASGTNSDPAGLFGINCRHTFRYIDEGTFMSREKPVQTEKEIAENNRQYALSQEQRSIEREIRSWTREGDCLANVGLAEEAGIADARASQLRDEYEAFCKENGRTPRWERTEVY